MKYFSHVVFLLLLFVFLGCTSVQQANAVTNNKSSLSYNVTSVMTGNVKFKDNATVNFSGNGQLKNATITGKNIKVVANGATQIFNNCNFSNATLVNSSLTGRNFGLKSDMKSRSRSVTYKGLRWNINERYGSDNTQAWQMLAQCLTGSNNVTVTLNGDFYSPIRVPSVTITKARNLQISGIATLIMGLKFVDCANCQLHDLNFVGLHTAHDFPPIYSSAPTAANGINYSKANSYNCVADGLAPCGLAGDGIQIVAATADPSMNRDFRVERCHFEMRQNGLFAGNRSDKLIVRNIEMENCTYSHIYYQPVGLHVSGATVNNVRGSYCMQGVDLSTTCNNVTVTNCSFADCASGPKQESTAQFRSMSHHNVFDNCSFIINEKYLLLDASQYIISVAEGPSGDTFTVRNSTFDIKKTRPLTSAMCRAYRTVLENVVINIDIPLDNSYKGKYSMFEMFSVYGATSFVPKLELNNVKVNIASGTTVNALFFPHCNGGFDIAASNLSVSGSGKIESYFENISIAVAQDCNFNIPAKCVASAVSSFNASRCKVQSATTFVKCNNATRQLSLTDNEVNVTGNEAITGLDGVHAKASSFKISGNAFKSTNRSMKIMSNAAQKKLSSAIKNNSVR